jgi:hypothetical protein
MSFAFNTLTRDGADLIAQATAANPIVFVDCLCGQRAAVSSIDLQNKPASFYSLGSGTIFSASATDNVARIMMAFDTAEFRIVVVNPVYIKSACVRARLQSQTDEDAVILCACSDPESRIQVPDMDAPQGTIYIPICAAITADSTIATVSAECASLADLDRFVSMYKAGNPFQGEPQTIRGNKTFSGDTYFVGPVHTDDNVQIDGDLSVLGGCILSNGCVAYSLKTDKLICSNQKITISPDGGGCDFTFEVQGTGHYNTCEIKATSEDGNGSGFIRFEFSGGVSSLVLSSNSFAPNSNRGSNLGTSARYWDSAYLYTITANSGAIDTINCNDLSVLNTITVNGMSGLEPVVNASNKLHVPIGGIVCAYRTGGWLQIRIGQNITIADNNIEVYASCLDGTAPQTKVYLEAGNYTFISEPQSYSSGGGIDNDHAALLMRSA